MKNNRKKIHNSRIHFSRKEYREEYLQSKEWKQISLVVLSRDRVCRICDEADSVHVHHLTYKRVGGFEDIETDLIGVCATCHNRIHHHKELVDIDNLNELKIVFHKSKKKYVLKEDILLEIINAAPIYRRQIANILNLVANSDKAFWSLLNRKVHFFKMKKIFNLLDCNKKHLLSPVKPKRKDQIWENMPKKNAEWLKQNYSWTLPDSNRY